MSGKTELHPGLWVHDHDRGFELVASTRIPRVMVAPVLGVLMVPAFVLFGWPGRSYPFACFAVAMLAAVVTLEILFRHRGRLVVRVDGDRGRIFTGVGPFGVSRRFRPGEVEGVEMEDRPRTGAERVTYSLFEFPRPRIVLLGRKLIKFGGGLYAERRKAMVHALRERLEPG